MDAGFSFTHVVPIMSGSIIWNAVKRLSFVESSLFQANPLMSLHQRCRIDVGGKLLTNHLKELVSFRQWNMMDETYIINDVKEQCCYVSSNFKQELDTCR